MQQTSWHPSTDDGADSPAFSSSLPILAFTLVLSACSGVVGCQNE